MVYCSRCEKFVTLFMTTKKGKKYCSDCWHDILLWVKNTQGINPTGCFLCGDEPVVWSDNVFINFRQLQLCEDCYNSYILNLKKLEVVKKKNG